MLAKAHKISDIGTFDDTVAVRRARGVPIWLGSGSLFKSPSMSFFFRNFRVLKIRAAVARHVPTGFTDSLGIASHTECKSDKEKMQ
jgi:hypothetical protein